jgi:hypothetical protein
MTPPLQKTWQGGTTLGGVDLVNQAIDEATSELTARTALLAIKQALTTFNLNPWTVVSSSNGVVADGTDNWATVADLVYPTTFGTAYSWVVLQQTNLLGTFEVLLSMFDIAATDPNRQNLVIKYAAGGGYVAGAPNVQPFAPGGDVILNNSGESWLGELTTGEPLTISCIQSDDGEVTRILVSVDSTAKPFTAIGFEKPRLPNPLWTDPVVCYILKETVASGLNCFRRSVMQETSPFQATIVNLASSDIDVGLRMTGPQRSTGEVIDEIQQSIHFWGGGLSYDGVDAQGDWGTLYDWYWVNRNVGGVHAIDGDSFPVGGDRTFVCPGDCVIGWLDDAATDLELFNWSGKFDNMPTAHADSELWLGIEGSESTDLSAVSHVFRLNTVVPIADTGSGLDYELGLNTGAALVLDANYELGAVGRGVQEFTSVSHRIGRNGGTYAIPNPMDGTRSSMIIGSHTPFSTNDGTAQSQRSIFWNRSSSSTRGWSIFYYNDNHGTERRLRARWKGVNGEHNVTTPFLFQYDLPIWFMAVFDTALLKITLCVAQGSTIQYDEFAAPNLYGDHSNGEGIYVGDAAGLHGTFPQASFGRTGIIQTFDWSSAIPSGITIGNAQRYLKYTDGILS